MASSALVIIDLQNDFKSLIDEGYITKLKQLLDNARTLGHRVIWVYSHYANDAMHQEFVPWSTMDEMCQRTHTGKTEYCKRGSEGAQFIPSVEELMHPDRDLQIKKTFYSAFTETQLEAKLKKLNISKLYIGGVTATTCVKATTYNACKLGYSVVACTDIIRAFGKQAKFDAAIDEYKAFPGGNIRILNNKEVLEATTSFGYQGKAKLHLDCIPTDVLDVSFDRIKNEVPWCEMISHGAPVPRLVCCMGDHHYHDTPGGEGGVKVPLYRHPVDCQPMVDPWTPAVEQIKNYISSMLGVPINHALIQLYRDGTDYIGEHSDKTLDIVAGTPILNFTIGATRHMLVREKSPEAVAEKVPLKHNSLFEFDLVTNEKCRHEIRPNKRPECEKTEEEKVHGGARISFTFRSIGTFIDMKTGEITGQGARKDGNNAVEDFKQMHAAFSEENRSRDFDYSTHYGCGFNALYVTSMSREFVYKRVELPGGKTKEENQMILHYVSGSVPSWKVEAMLHELGIPYEKKRERVMVKLSEKLAQLNWRQLTPTLIDTDGLVVRESWAILQYLENKFLSSSDSTRMQAIQALFPRSTHPTTTAAPTPPTSSSVRSREVAYYARVMEYAYAADDLLKKRFGPVEDILMKKMHCISDDEASVQAPALMAKLEEELQFWETQVLDVDKRWKMNFLLPADKQVKSREEIEGSNFLVGNTFTIADLSAVTCIAFVVHRGLPMAKYPNIAAYYFTHIKRDSIKGGTPDNWNLEKPDGPNIFQRYHQRCVLKWAGGAGAGSDKKMKKTSPPSATATAVAGEGLAPPTAVVVATRDDDDDAEYHFDPEFFPHMPSSETF